LIAEVVSKPGAGSQLSGRSVLLRARGLVSATPLGSRGRRPPRRGEEAKVLTEAKGNEEIIGRVAALDIGKVELVR
jgi:hypothetical protein